MDFAGRYQLFLFDFDGLLVNTEHLHHLAYLRTLEGYGKELGWSFADFCRICHPDSEGSSRAIGAQFPQLMGEVGWETIYRKKGEHYLRLLKEGGVALMPGAAELLEGLAERGIKRAVVTHSRPEQVALLKEQHPILSTVPHWITREQYTRPKPHPECYIRALALRGVGERAVGFEDSLRGVQALKGCGIDGVLVGPPDYPFLKEAVRLGAIHLTELNSVSL
ncbi:MAG: HAD family hydrolase [Parachlamydiales bacterium]